MSDFSFSDDQELLRLNAQVVSRAMFTSTPGYLLTITTQLSDPEVFENWDQLVRAAEAQEGGLHRNSSPGAIASTRDVYDKLLARFPLFFGYWKKYADLEFNIGGTEAAEMVRYKRLEDVMVQYVDICAGLRAWCCLCRHVC